MPPRLVTVDLWLHGSPLALYPEARLVRWPLGVPVPAPRSWLDSGCRLLPCSSPALPRVLLLGERDHVGRPRPWSELARAEAAATLGLPAVARAFHELHAARLVAIGTRLCPYLREQIRSGTPAPFDRLNYVVGDGTDDPKAQINRWNAWSRCRGQAPRLKSPDVTSPPTALSASESRRSSA